MKDGRDKDELVWLTALLLFLMKKRQVRSLKNNSSGARF